jgi:hypothetical protein
MANRTYTVYLYVCSAQRRTWVETSCEKPTDARAAKWVHAAVLQPGEAMLCAKCETPVAKNGAMHLRPVHVQGKHGNVSRALLIAAPVCTNAECLATVATKVDEKLALVQPRYEQTVSGQWTRRCATCETLEAPEVVLAVCPQCRAHEQSVKAYCVGRDKCLHHHMDTVCVYCLVAQEIHK